VGRGGWDGEGREYILSEEEERAIAALQRLARKWPRSLKLFSWSGSLVVVPADAPLGEMDDPSSAVLAAINGIPNDGGDPG
jgi:hypothetical protein